MAEMRTAHLNFPAAIMEDIPSHLGLRDFKAMHGAAQHCGGRMDGQQHGAAPYGPAKSHRVRDFDCLPGTGTEGSKGFESTLEKCKWWEVCCEMS